MQVAIYARCSTDDQSVDMQVADLRRYCAGRNWQIVAEYLDAGISGAVSSRPELDRMLADARRGSFEAVIVWKFDRMSRSVRHMIAVLDELRAVNVDFVSFQEAIDTTTPVGKCMFTIVAAFAELERSVTKQRCLSGLREHQRKLAAGILVSTRSGKNLPVGRPKRVFDRERVRQLRAAGASWSAISEEMGLPIGTIRGAMAGS